jgi:gamma-glutamyltranspeptidase/glutathione hydrolase
MGFKLFGPLLRAAFAGAAFLALAATAGAQPREAVVVAANPHAVAAGMEMLRAGGSATDAAIAAELVLGLVEPQSSGLGGGGFLLHYDARARRIEAFDGRETAPADAAPGMFLDEAGRPLNFRDAVTSGRSIGAPSLVPMLRLAHDAHGRLPWARLFEPAIRLADEGFAVSPRMRRWIGQIAGSGGFAGDAAARAYLLTPAGEPLAVGTMLRNPAYAQTLRAVAAEGPRAMTEGPVAAAIVAAARAEPRPGRLALSDLRRVHPRRLRPVCGAFRLYLVCSMPPPSSGGVAVIELLGLYARARPHPDGDDDPDDWAAFLWASRLAYLRRSRLLCRRRRLRARAHARIALPGLSRCPRA